MIYVIQYVFKEWEGGFSKWLRIKTWMGEDDQDGGNHSVDFEIHIVLSGTIL
jgi:hypothetical protein